MRQEKASAFTLVNSDNESTATQSALKMMRNYYLLGNYCLFCKIGWGRKSLPTPHPRLPPFLLETFMRAPHVPGTRLKRESWKKPAVSTLKRLTIGERWGGEWRTPTISAHGEIAMIECTPRGLREHRSRFAIMLEIKEGFPQEAAFEF